LYINKLHDLISDLLDVSKIQAGKLTFNIAVFDYSELVREVVESIQPTSPSHRIMIHMDSSFKVRGDRNRIEQVLNNLLSNGIKYSPYQSEIDVTVVEKDHKIVTSVRDYGVGISPKDQKRLFERFYRAQKIAKDFSGLGIGLFISSEIVKRHSGTIWVESIEDKGSTFSFTLPSIS
jgi:signal transduction histidine kinase